MNAVTPDNADRALLVALQKGVPLVARPFAVLGATCGLTEDDVLARVRGLFETGTARRFGAVFDSRSLGYGSTLCAVDVPDADLDRVAAQLTPHPGVTHCYEREGRPNLWFTLTAAADRFDAELAALAGRLAPHVLRNLPALRRYKVEVVLDATAEDADSLVPRLPGAGAAPSARAFTETERAAVRALQGNVPLGVEPFKDLAAGLSLDPDALLGLLNEWKTAGILRRIGVILRHREAGYLANGMCVWRVPVADVERAGSRIARAPEVTHCYERPPFPGFPYNLFAMIHARERSAALSVFERLSVEAGLSEGRMLTSAREFKKASPIFFCEDDTSGRGSRS